MNADHSLAEARRAIRENADFAPLRALVPYAAFLGLKIRQDASALSFHLPFRPSLIGNVALPALHGGVVAALMENAAQLHLLLQLDESKVPKSIDFSIDYLRSAHAEDCYAACDVARLGRRVAQVQIRCWQGADARTVALARAHFLLEASDSLE